MPQQKTSQIFNANQLPPQNIEAEKSTLGAILLDKEAINRIADFLRPEDFYNRAHQLVFAGMFSLFEKREPIDLLSLSNKLEEMGHLETVGGAGYLTSLINTVPSSSNIVHYAKIVERKKILRDLIDSAHYIIGLSNQEEEEIDQILDQAEQKLFSISQKSSQSSFAHIGGPMIKEAFDRLDRPPKRDGQTRGPTPPFFYPY